MIQSNSSRTISPGVQQRAAFHEAGHATAICIYNKLKKLPPVFFQITIKNNKSGAKKEMLCKAKAAQNPVAKVEGGRLIENLPASIDATGNPGNNTPEPDLATRKALISALEADVITLLSGVLAEAKFVADCDGERINGHLLNLDSLQYYRESVDLALVNDYIRCLIPNKKERNEKLTELFARAFDFVNEYSIWNDITRLANYILEKNHTIDCEEIIRVLDDDKTSLQAQEHSMNF